MEMLTLVGLTSAGPTLAAHPFLSSVVAVTGLLVQILATPSLMKPTLVVPISGGRLHRRESCRCQPHGRHYHQPTASSVQIA